MIPSTKSYGEMAAAFFARAEIVIDFYTGFDPTADLTRARTHLRNAGNNLQWKHFSACVRNCERTVDATLDCFLAEIVSLERDFPDLAETEAKKLRSGLGKLLIKAREGGNLDGLYGLRDQLADARQRFTAIRRTPSDKNVPQRGRDRVPKKSSRGPGRHSRRRGR